MCYSSDGEASCRPSPRASTRPSHGARQNRDVGMSAASRDRFNPDRDVKEWTGPDVPYDILKEALSPARGRRARGALAVVFSSPDEHAVTLKSWSTADPVDFAQTAITQLDGTSPVATYGPPTTRRLPPRSTSASSSQPNGWASISRSIPRRTSSSTRCERCLTIRVSRTRLRTTRTPHRPSSGVDNGLREGRRQVQRIERDVTSARRRLRPGRDNDRRADFDGTERRPRRHAAQPRGNFTTPITQSRSSSSRAVSIWPTSPGSSISKELSGE